MKTSRRRLLQGAGGAALAAQLGAIRRVAAATVPSPSGGRADYLLDDGVAYLNHASIGTVPRVVHAAHVGYLELCESNPWLYMWSDPWREPVDEVRTQVGNLLGCATEEVALVHNTTEFFNTLAQGLPIGPGDEVLFSSLNHSGASVCWENQAPARGFSVRRFDWPLDRVPEMTADEVVELHAGQISSATAVLVLPHVDNRVGLRHPVRRLAALARERGVRWVLIDGAQSVNVLPVDVGQLDVDAYVTSAHKWTQSPKGLGFAYVRRERQGEIRPMWVTWGQRLWGSDARRFEDYGTRALPAVIALGDALAFQARLEPSEREARHRGLWATLRKRAAEVPQLRWRSPSSWDLAAGLSAVSVEGRSSAEVGRALFEEHGIVMRAFSEPGFDALRISPNLMNSADDLERWAGLAVSDRRV